MVGAVGKKRGRKPSCGGVGLKITAYLRHSNSHSKKNYVFFVGDTYEKTVLLILRFRRKIIKIKVVYYLQCLYLTSFHMRHTFARYLKRSLFSPTPEAPLIFRYLYVL